MAKRRPTLADAALTRHLREEATKKTTEEFETRQFRRYVIVIFVAVVMIGLVVAWAFFDVGAEFITGI